MRIEDFYYALGFAQADGTLRKTNRGDKLQLVFLSTEREILEKLKEALGIGGTFWGGDLRKDKPKNKAVWGIGTTNQELVLKFIRSGLVEKKTWLAGEMEVPERYFGHFLRGYWDGDGCISKVNGKYLRLTCAGSAPRYLEWLQKRLGGIGAQFKIYTYPKLTFQQLHASGANALPALKEMYKEDGIFLERKALIARQWLGVS